MSNQNLLKKWVNLILYLMGFFSTFYIIRIKSFQLTTLLAFVCIMSVCFLKQKINLINVNRLFLAFIISVIATSFLNLFLPMEDTYKIKVSIVALIELFILYLSAEQIKQLDKYSISKLISGLRMSCYIHIIWCLLQFVAYNFFEIDINQIIFGDLLHMSNGDYGVSRYEAGRLVISGLCWHPINLAPTLALSVLLLNKWYVWFAAFFIAFYSDNSTTMVVLATVFVLCLLTVFKGKIGKVIKSLQNPKVFFKIFIILFISVLILIQLIPLIQKSFNGILDRVQNTNDSSTQAHIQYYTAWPMIARKQNIIELLFGCGLGRSGAFFTRFFNQYTFIDYWSVESDPMNYLYAAGLIGFLLFYSWLIVLIVKARKISIKYVIFLLSIIAGGITYGMQFPWVINLELMIGVCVCKNIDIFENTDMIKSGKLLYLYDFGLKDYNLKFIKQNGEYNGIKH